jgi:hypothetical protein
MSGILGASGVPMVAFGGMNAWKVYKKGNIVVSFQWAMLSPDADMPEPCMCLYAENRMSMNGGAYVIPQCNAYWYADSKTGEPTPDLVTAAKSAAEHLGFFPDKWTCFAIAEAIVDALPDLIAMPDLPPKDLEKKLFHKPVQGIHMTVKQGGQVVGESIV